MDIFSFINSTDISNYLKEIKYEFSPLEAAWLIYRCKNLSYVQKKKAWNELISAIPDIRTPKRMNCDGYESLHELLKKYMEIVEKELADFGNGEKQLLSLEFFCLPIFTYDNSVNATNFACV